MGAIGCIGCCPIGTIGCIGCMDPIGCICGVPSIAGCSVCSVCSVAPAWLIPAVFVSSKNASSKGMEGGGAAGFASFFSGIAVSTEVVADSGNARKLNGSELTGFASGFSAGRSDSGLSGVSFTGGSRESGCLESAERSRELEKEAPWRIEAASKMQTSHCSSLTRSSSFTSTNVHI